MLLFSLASLRHASAVCHCRRRYHLQDVVTGKIYFLLVRIRIKHMELAIVRRESAGTGVSRCLCCHSISLAAALLSATPVPVRGHVLLGVKSRKRLLSVWVCAVLVARAASNVYHETDTLTKFEVMDGAPVRGESVPIRLYLSGFDLTPTYRNIINMYTVRYYLNLVIVDEEDRRYFKQQEILLWRSDAH